MQIEITVPTSAKLMARAAKRFRPGWVRLWRLFGAVSGLFGVVLGFANGWAAASAFFIVCGIFIVFIPDLNALAISRRYARVIGPQAELELNDLEVRYRTSAGLSSTPWASFVGYVDTTESWILGLSRHLFIVIPKGSLTSEQQAEVSEFIAQQGIGGSKA